MRRAGTVAFFELGPGNVLSNISRRVDRDARIIDVFDESAWADLVVDDHAEVSVVESRAPRSRHRKTAAR